MSPIPPSRSSRAGRAAGLLGRIAIDSAREPAYLVSLARGFAGSAADRDFDRRSPIPTIAPAVLDRILGSEIVLPPPALFESGNQSLEGVVFLVSLVRALEARTIFEIGTYNGLTAWTLARNLPKATVHTLDLAPSEETVLPLGPKDAGNRAGSQRSVLGLLGSSDRVVQHWGDSASFDFAPWTSCCELVYVDGAHSVEYVASDTENALRMLSDRGAIVWDDYWRVVPEIAQVLDTRTDLDLRRVPGTRLVVMLSRGATRWLAGPAADPADGG